MVYELTHGTQRFLLFPRLLTLHTLSKGDLKDVTVISEDAMISLLNTYNWSKR